MNHPPANLNPKLPISVVITTGKPLTGESTADMLREAGTLSDEKKTQAIEVRKTNTR
jgi:hypothetical protein